MCGGGKLLFSGYFFCVIYLCFLFFFFFFLELMFVGPDDANISHSNSNNNLNNNITASSSNGNSLVTSANANFSTNSKSQMLDARTADAARKLSPAPNVFVERFSGHGFGRVLLAALLTLPTVKKILS